MQTRPSSPLDTVLKPPSSASTSRRAPAGLDRLGILIGSLVSGLAGYAVLRLVAGDRSGPSS